MKSLKILSLVALAVVVNCTDAFSQTAQPASTPPVDDQAVKITTNLIQLDVVVTDKNGNVVRDLKPEDFEITENNNKREISGFSFVMPKGEMTKGEGNTALVSSNSSNIHNTTLNVDAVGRIMAIVVDDARMSEQSITITKRALEKIIRSDVQGNDLVAIVKTSGSTGIEQRFTNNKDLLLKWVSEIKYQPSTSVGLSPFAPMSISFGQSASSLVAGMGILSSGLNAEISNRPEVEAISQDFRDQFVTQGALENLQRTIDAMGSLRGRKALLFVSEGVNLRYNPADTGGGFGGASPKIPTVAGGPLAGTEMSTPIGNQIELTSAKSVAAGGKNYTIDGIVKYITEIANRNGVSIFTSDPRGAVTTNFSAADSNKGALGTGSEAMSRDQIDSKITGRNLAVQYSQETLKELSNETGGKAFVNNNDIEGSIKAALNSQKGYYLLAYQPDEETFDPKTNRFNKLTVKVKRPNMEVEYRSGFFNVAFADKHTPQSDDVDALRKLLAPYNYTDVGVQVAAISAYGDQKSTAIRSFISVPAKDLAVTDGAAGKKMAKFDVIVAVIDDNGIPLGFSAKNYTVSYDPKTAADFLKSDVVSNFTFQMGKPGVYKIRVMVRDSTSKRIGTATQTILAPDLDQERIALSGLLLQNLTASEWQTTQTDPTAFARMAGEKTPNDTALRRFKKGTILSFIYSVYASADVTKNGPVKITAATRLMKDGNAILNGAPEEITLPANTKSTSINRRGAISLASTMAAGRYTLQLEINAPSAPKIETQSIDFEIID